MITLCLMADWYQRHCDGGGGRTTSERPASWATQPIGERRTAPTFPPVRLIVKMRVSIHQYRNRTPGIHRRAVGNSGASRSHGVDFSAAAR
jgi:hypothetical protein